MLPTGVQVSLPHGWLPHTLSPVAAFELRRAIICIYIYIYIYICARATDVSTRGLLLPPVFCSCLWCMRNGEQPVHHAFVLVKRLLSSVNRVCSFARCCSRRFDSSTCVLWVFVAPLPAQALSSSVLAKFLLDFGCFARVPAFAVQRRPNVSQSRAAMTITVFSEIDFTKRWHHKHNNHVHALATILGFARRDSFRFCRFFAGIHGAVSLKEIYNLLVVVMSSILEMATRGYRSACTCLSYCGHWLQVSPKASHRPNLHSALKRDADFLLLGCFARVPAFAVQRRPNVSQSRAAMTITVFSEIDLIKIWHHKHNNHVHALAKIWVSPIGILSVFVVFCAGILGAVSLKEMSNLLVVVMSSILEMATRGYRRASTYLSYCGHWIQVSPKASPGLTCTLP